MRHVLGDFGRKRSGGGSTSSGGPPYKKPASTKQRAGNSEHAASEQAAPSSEQEREASSEKRPGNCVRAGSSEQAAATARDGVVHWSESLLPTREQELANRLGIDSCFKCKGKDWELVKSCDDCGELICADCDNNYGGIGIPTWCGMGRCSGTLTLPQK